MQCHTDPPDCDAYFGCISSFTPLQDEVCSIDVPDKKKKKKPEATYLPGEKLLIQLGKQRKKDKQNRSNLIRSYTSHEEPDIDRASASLRRILSF